MPTYQYSCTACGHSLEAVQAFTDEALTECPECGGRLRKVYSAVGVVFKGSGFYRTDSRTASTGSPSTSSTAGTSGKSDSTGSSGSGSAASTPSKPAGATTAKESAA